MGDWVEYTYGRRYICLNVLSVLANVKRTVNIVENKWFNKQF